MPVQAIEQASKSLGNGEELALHYPLFCRYDASSGEQVLIEVLGADSCEVKFSTLPTMKGLISWHPLAPYERPTPNAHYRVLFWNDDATMLVSSILETDSSRATPILIAHRLNQAPPKEIAEWPTTRVLYTGAPEYLLARLALSLVAPIAFDGLICVDHLDFVKALNRGGVVRALVGSSRSLSSAFGALLEDGQTTLGDLGTNATLCVSVLGDSSELNFEVLDPIFQELHKLAWRKPLMLLSALSHEENISHVSIFSVSPDPI